MKVPIEKPSENCVGFEDVELGAAYNVGDVFQSAGATIYVQKHQLENGQWTSNGHAEIQDVGMAGGTGQDIWTSNVNLRIDFGAPVDGLSLLFGWF